MIPDRNNLEILSAMCGLRPESDQAGGDAGRRHGHYFKRFQGVEIDVYRVLALFEVSDPCIQHAVKKLLCAGGRGHKDMEKDVREAMDSLMRWDDMRVEDFTTPKEPVDDVPYL